MSFKYSILVQILCTLYLCDIAYIASNTGGHVITEKTLDHWTQARSRQELQLMDMEQLITLGAFNEQGATLCSYGQ
jgi:hypothetical protein